MTGDREMRTTRGLNDTQLMLARDAGDERDGIAIAPPGPRRRWPACWAIIKSANIKGEKPHRNTIVCRFADRSKYNLKMNDAVRQMYSGRICLDAFASKPRCYLITDLNGSRTCQTCHNPARP
jgi:hypothetical protein